MAAQKLRPAASIGGGVIDEQILRRLVAEPGRTGLFLDFDGTLSEIVDVPSEARPVAGAAEVLAGLGRRLAVVAVVSGRAAGELLDWLGPDVEIWGVHGAQTTSDGKVVVSESAAPYVEAMADVLAEARREVADLGIDGAVVEDKGVAITLHYRAAADRGRAHEALESMAADFARRYDLAVAPGRASFELRPGIELSKAAVVFDRARSAGLSAAAFVGDDLVDLPAFDALDELGREGMTTVRVAVASDEAPRELLERADIVVDGPHGAVDLLNRLLADA